MSKYFLTAILLVAIIGSVLCHAYKTTHLIERDSELSRSRRDTVEDGKDAEEGTNQGVIATYWNNFLNSARLPLPSWNITNPISNLFTPYVVEVDHQPENNQQPNLILLDPATQQYYKVQPVSP